MMAFSNIDYPVKSNFVCKNIRNPKFPRPSAMFKFASQLNYIKELDSLHEIIILGPNGKIQWIDSGFQQGSRRARVDQGTFH